MKKKWIIIISVCIVVLLLIIATIVFFASNNKKEELKDMVYMCTTSGKTPDYTISEDVKVVRKNKIVTRDVSSKIVYTSDKAYNEGKEIYKFGQNEYDDENRTIFIHQGIEKVDLTLDEYLEKLEKYRYKCNVME